MNIQYLGFSVCGKATGCVMDLNAHPDGIERWRVYLMLKVAFRFTEVRVRASFHKCIVSPSCLIQGTPLHTYQFRQSSNGQCTEGKILLYDRGPGIPSVPFDCRFIKDSPQHVILLSETGIVK